MMRHSFPSVLAKSRSARRSRKPVARAVASVVEQLENRLFLSVNVLSYRDGTTDNVGVNSQETILTPTNVKVGSFGKLFTTAVDGQIYAQPLVDSAVTIASGVNTTAGVAGLHNVVYVCTENDSVYAIDTQSGQILWQRSFLSTANTGGNQNNSLGATAITTVTSTDVSSTDITPVIGITSTPVIDASTGVMYLLAKTKDMINGVTTFVQTIHALHITDGTDAATPFVIGETSGTNTNTTPIYVYGTGDGHITDPYNNTNKQVVQFNALTENNRSALSLVNGTLYVAWASHGDNGPYHGWVVTWNVSNLASGMVINGVLNTCPNNGEAGVWQGGGQMVFEPDDSAFYFLTGNGTAGAPTIGANGLPTDASYNEAVVKAVVDLTTTATNQNSNGWGLKITSFFTPYNVVALDGADSDFGSGALTLLPPSAGIAGHPNLLIAGGKDGRLFVLDRNNLGGFNAVNDNALNSVPNGSGNNTAPVAVNGLLSASAYFNGKLYVLGGYYSTGQAFTLSASGTLSSSSQTSLQSMGYVPGGPIISSNGITNGIVWIMDRNSNAIRAYDANTFSTELWDSWQAAGSADAPGSVVKFAEPVVANGEVFVGTAAALVVYGLLAAPTAVPQAPALSVQTLSGSSINLTWTDPSVTPNLATSYSVEESTDDATFNVVATAPSGATSLAIGGLLPNTIYYFRIRGHNAIGYSNYSNTPSATTTNQSALLDFSSGFGTTAGTLTLNGSSAVNGTALELTNGGTNEAASAFSTSPVDVSNFSTQFQFQIAGGSNTADGFTFALENVAPTAIGPFGGGLGYGPDTTGGTGGIPNSAAIKFDLYSNQGEGSDSTGLYTGGAAPTTVGSIDMTSSGINLHSGDVMNVTLSYDGTTVTETITDATAGKSFSQTYVVNLSSALGGTSAYVGFTAGTGGITAVQNILNWTFSPGASVSPNAPTGLGATPASATSVNLNWTNNATNQTGYYLDRATDTVFTQNLITQTLPASPALFTDSAAGLAAGQTFYYRIRAFNTAGPSGYSNTASVAIPMPPPKPTNQSITLVSSTEIDMSWTDNAGHLAQGYHILRAVNHGSFVTWATLPPTSRTAPSPYSFSDTGLTPGFYYEYHIQAFNVAGYNDFAGVNATTLTTPPVLSAVTGNSSVNLSWTAPTGAVSYNLYRGTTPGGEGTTPYIGGLTTTSYSDSNLTAGVTYYYTVTALNGNTAPLPSESAPSNEVSSLASGLPSPWQAVSIGAVGIPGSATYNAGTFTINASGSDIYGTADAFEGVFQSLAADGSIVARVTGVPPGAYAKTGVMIRASSAANSPEVAMVVTPSGAFFEYRSAAGGITNYNQASGTIPLWVKLVRAGNVFTGSISSNGSTWSQVGTVTIAMSNPVEIGMATTAWNNNLLGTGTLDNVTVTGATALPASKLAFAQQPGTAVAGQAIAPPVTVKVEDTNGNVITTDTSTVTLAVASGPGTLSGTVAAPASAGIATFSNLALSAAGTYTLNATDSSLTLATSSSFTISSAALPASKLAFAQQPGTAIVGQAIAPPVTVKVEDTNGNVVGTDTSTVTLAVASGPGSLSGTVAAQASGGIATFSNLALSSAGTYTLNATDSLLTLATSSSFTVNSAAVGLPVPWQAVSIGSVGVAGSATYSNGTFTLNGSGTDIYGTVDAFEGVFQTLNGDGQVIARVTGLPTTGAYAKAGVMIRASTAANSQEAAMILTPSGAFFENRATTGAITNYNQVSGTTPLWVKVTRAGNLLSGFISSNGTTWSLVGSTMIAMGTSVQMGLATTSWNNNALGTATFDNVSVITGTALPASKLAFIQQPSNATIALAISPPVTVAVEDINGNVISTDSSNVTLAVNTGPGSLGGTIVAQASGGIATFSNLTLASVGTYTLNANDSTLALATSSSFTVSTASTGLPSPWQAVSVGSVGIAGSATYSNGTFTVNGSGADIYGTVDAFEGVFQSLTGGATIIAQVVGTPPGAYAKTGVMIRAGTGANAQEVAMVVTPSGAFFEYRSATGGITNYSQASGAAPLWVKLNRTGNVFTGYISSNGTTWTLVGSTTITMTDPLQIGLVTTSWNNKLLGTGLLANVSVGP